MDDRQDRFCHDIVLKFIQQVIHLYDRTRRGIFDRKDRIIRRPFFDRLHCVAESPHMETVHILPEKLLHSRLSVRPICSLKHDPGILFVQVVDPDKRKTSQRSGFYKLLILQLPAHGHDLLVKFLDPLLVKVSAHF